MLGTETRRRLARTRSAWAGAGVVGALLAFSLVVPLVDPHDPYASDFVHGVASASGLPVGPCAAFPLGADRIFRDVLARLACGGRLSLAVAVAATLMATAIGATVGILAGYVEGRRVPVPWPALAGASGALVLAGVGRGGAAAACALAGLTASVLVRRGPQLDVDAIVMRAVDVLLAFPFLLLVMAIGAALQHTTAWTVLVVLGATGWLGTARLLRAKTLQVRGRDYVVASRALGQSTIRVVLAHVLPNVAGPLVVTATMQVAQMIVADSVLSYLGVGVAPPTPTWGRMLFEGQDYYASAPWLVLAPGGAILLAAWGFNLLGEGLRDALDPRA